MPNTKRKLTQSEALKLSKYIKENSNKLTIDDYIKMSSNYQEGSMLESELKRIKDQKQNNPQKYKDWEDKGGVYYYHDKQIDHVFKITPSGNVISATPALRGTQPGDQQNTSNLITTKGATTPSGRFGIADSFGYDKDYPLGFYDYNKIKLDNSYLGLHQVYKNDPSRLRKMFTPSESKCGSFGCSNVPENWIAENRPLSTDSMIVSNEPSVLNKTDYSIYDKIVPNYSKQDNEYWNFIDNNIKPINYKSPTKIIPPNRNYEIQRTDNSIEKINSINLKDPVSLENNIIQTIPKPKNILNELFGNQPVIRNIMNQIKNIITPDLISRIDMKEMNPITITTNVPISKSNTTPDLINKIDVKEPSFIDIAQSDNILKPINNNIENKNVDLQLENIPKNNNMPTINEIMQYALGKKNTKPLSINKDFIIDDENSSDYRSPNQSTVLKDKTDNSILSNSFIDLIEGLQGTNPNQNSPILKSLTDAFVNNPISVESIIKNQNNATSPITPTDVIASSTTKVPTAFTLDEQKRLENPPPKVVQPMSILEDIQKRNKSLENRTSALNTAKVFDDVKSLLNNINEGDGLAPVESTHLISPEIKYDDTIRNKMVQESIKQSQIAQSNAMKMGMSGLIPAIDNNARRGMNEANAQAQTQINQIQQQNALQGANTANNEQQIFIQQRDKIIQDGIAKNAARYAAIGQSKESLYGDLQTMMAQKQTFDQEDIKARVYSYMQAHPSMSEDEKLRLMQLAGLNTAGVFKTFNSGNKTSNTDEMVINNEIYVKQPK